MYCLATAVQIMRLFLYAYHPGRTRKKNRSSTISVQIKHTYPPSVRQMPPHRAQPSPGWTDEVEIPPMMASSSRSSLSMADGSVKSNTGCCCLVVVVESSSLLVADNAADTVTRGRTSGGCLLCPRFSFGFPLKRVAAVVVVVAVVATECWFGLRIVLAACEGAATINAFDTAAAVPAQNKSAEPKIIRNAGNLIVVILSSQELALSSLQSDKTLTTRQKLFFTSTICFFLSLCGKEGKEWNGIAKGSSLFLLSCYYGVPLLASRTEQMTQSHVMQEDDRHPSG
jgi:hypothetical protein